MADIEKMREIFEEVLEKYEKEQRGWFDDRSLDGGAYFELEEEVKSFRTRFNEAVMANQAAVTNNITVTVDPSKFKDIQELMDKMKRFFEGTDGFTNAAGV